MQQNPHQQRVLYRYRTFAERLGPSNAKSILLHYLGVLALAAAILKLRAMFIAYADTCDDPIPTPEPDEKGHYSAQVGIAIKTTDRCLLSFFKKSIGYGQKK